MTAATTTRGRLAMPVFLVAMLLSAGAAFPAQLTKAAAEDAVPAATGQEAVAAGLNCIPLQRIESTKVLDDHTIVVALADLYGRLVGKRVTGEYFLGHHEQGIGVQFTQDDTGAAARVAIEKILGETLASSRPTHTM